MAKPTAQQNEAVHGVLAYDVGALSSALKGIRFTTTQVPGGLAVWCVALACWLLGGCADEDVLLVSQFELRASPQAEPVAITLPRHLDEFLRPEKSEYRLETQVTLPDALRGRTLTLAIPHLYARAGLFVNDQEMVELDPEPEPYHRSRGTPRFRIPASLSQASSLHLSLRVQHTWTQSGWVDTPPRISASVAGDAFTRFTDSFNLFGGWVGLITVLVTCFTSLLVFLLDRRQVAFFWFAIEAIFGSSMPLFQIGIGTALFGVYDTVMLAAGVSIGLWASVRFTHAQFSLGPPHRLLDILLALTLLLIASGPGPFVVTDRAGPTVIAFISVNVIYQIVVTMRLWARGVRRVHALVLAVSWAALGVAASADQLAWIAFGELFGGVRAGPIGLAVIGLLHGAVLSHDYITTLKHADVLNLELAQRVRLLESKDLENTALNEVLRRQIAARSEQLAHAVVRLGSSRNRAAADLTVGAVLENRYRIVGTLGRGGMGTVYEVERLIDHKTFALKVLSASGGSVEMARFAREAQLVAQLQHPNVVSIVDVDVASNGVLFIVLELVRGSTLRPYMDRGVQDHLFATRVLEQIASGLSSIHASQIVHRDLKPDNILVLEDDRGGYQIKITDFGVSAVADSQGTQQAHEAAGSTDPTVRLTDLTVPLQMTPQGAAVQKAPDEEGALTEAGMLIGTPRYMAPEATESTTCAVDVFAFGVLAFELLTGRTPFAEPLVLLKLSGRPLPTAPDLSTFAADLPAALSSLLQRCLHEDPAQRPSTAELARAFAEHIPNLTVRTSPAAARA